MESPCRAKGQDQEQLQMKEQEQDQELEQAPHRSFWNPAVDGSATVAVLVLVLVLVAVMRCVLRIVMVDRLWTSIGDEEMWT